jgi:cytochrome c oxidase assembly factor CtaG
MMAMAGTSSDVVQMAVMGALTSVVAPALVLGTGRVVPSWHWDRLALPAAVVLPLFLVLHAGGTILLAGVAFSAPVELSLHVVLLLGAVLFWLPVLGSRHRLSDPARTAYLFLAAPSLDLGAGWVIAEGDSAGGLAMIVAMLPIGLAAVVCTWRWIVREERLTAAREREGGVTA